MLPTPFRVTGEDMGDAKVGHAIEPLIDSLNTSMNNITSILTGNVGLDNLKADVKSIQFDVDTMDGAFPLKFTTKIVRPSCVIMANCVPKDPAHLDVEPRVMQGFSLGDSGAVLVKFITGLQEQNSYQLTFLVL